MIWIIIIAIILLVIRAIYKSTGYYQVLVKTEYDSFKNDKGWLSMHTGKYGSCVKYVQSVKNVGTSQLGFRQSFKIKRLKL